jgi:hypothetical protein
MSTKTFKIGEWGSHPKWKISTSPGKIRVQMWNWSNDLEVDDNYNMGDLYLLESFLEEDATPYYASKVRDWVCSTEDFMASGSSGRRQNPYSIFN